MYLVNGERSESIDIADRGFQYGDGLFETIEVLNGRPLFLERHLKRLNHGCHRLLIPAPDQELLIAEAEQMSASTQRAVLKLIVTRGSGGRGYRQPAQLSPTRVFALYPFPDYPKQFHTDGVAVRLCKQRLGINQSLAGIKHLNRLEQILARAEWQNEEITEGIMLDHDNFVIEGTMSNVFLGKEGILYTPKLTNCGVAGIVRQMVIEFSTQYEIPLLEQEIECSALWQADEIFITNSILGICPVRMIEQTHFSIGTQTKKLQAMFNALRIELAS
ncbi:aminodeoxychorismate lyase [Methylomonas sp. AM2-LC]|uniref:aminodeoxychorismate lyase n=1 Tax=Methylomonas sp. AM2-LC TaxID=3153301 RepID=UPI003266E3CE